MCEEGLDNLKRYELVLCACLPPCTRREEKLAWVCRAYLMVNQHNDEHCSTYYIILLFLHWLGWIHKLLFHNCIDVLKKWHGLSPKEEEKHMSTSATTSMFEMSTINTLNKLCIPLKIKIKVFFLLLCMVYSPIGIARLVEW